MSYADPAPARITAHEWTEAFRRVPDELVRRYRYFGAADQPWSVYLSPPATFAVYGARRLKDFRFDNSLAALRLWGFVMNEIERLYRARQLGRRIVATLGDLGALPALVHAFPDAVPFYPDCLWWTPFLRNSRVLFDTAERAGLDETFCYSRAALAGFIKGAYFPRPDLCLAQTGASCDDYCAVMTRISDLGFDLVWLETPGRRDDDPAADARARAMLVGQYRRVLARLGGEDREGLAEAFSRVNRVRALTGAIRELVYDAPGSLLPALEMMLIEFGCLHWYADLREWTAILEHVLATVEDRRGRQIDLGAAGDVRLVWVTPPADPWFLPWFEQLGARVVGTEYVINQALVPIPETADPLEGLAGSFLEASLIGTSRRRAGRVIEQARRFRAEGIVISSVFGAAHCATENAIIRDEVAAQTGLPVLDFDVPAPGVGATTSLETRVEAFLELCRSRR